MSRIVLFGTGDRGKKLYELFLHYGIEIEYWIDSNKDKWNSTLERKPICFPEKIKNEKDICVCISAVDEKMDMYEKMLDYGIPKNRIKKFTEAVLDCLACCMPKTDSCVGKRKQCIILDCSNGLVLGGVETWSMDMLSGLREKGYEAYALSAYGEYDIKDEIKKNTLWVKTDPKKSFSWENLECFLKMLQFKLPCVLIASCVNDLLLATCSLKKKHPEHIKIIAVIHMGVQATYKEYAELDPYIEKYVAVSKDIQRGMVNCGIAAEKVLHMTCPVECVEPYVRNYSLNSEMPVRIGYAGRIEKAQKRMDCLIKILEELEKLGTNYYMEVAGTGSYFEELSEVIKEHGLEHKVKLAGRIARERIPRFWSEQDICINLSGFEGRSISVMEAMKNGAVPIVTDTSGVREDIEHGVNGYIVAVDDYMRIAEKIDHLSRNRKMLEVFGELAHRAMKKSNAEEHMNFWDEFLKKECI